MLVRWRVQLTSQPLTVRPLDTPTVRQLAAPRASEAKTH